jgi:hypothetical protein
VTFEYDMHRIDGITRRALDIAAQRLPSGTVANIDGLQLAPIDLPLATMSDDETAKQIADAILEALALKLRN